MGFFFQSDTFVVSHSRTYLEYNIAKHQPGFGNLLAKDIAMYVCTYKHYKAIHIEMKRNFFFSQMQIANQNEENCL